MDDTRSPAWWATKLYNDLAYAAPEMWMEHITRRFEEALDQPDNVDDEMAKAVLKWYDTTHGDYFGHDHHCPVYVPIDKIYTQELDDRCTCGWNDVLIADKKRTEEYLVRKG